MRRAIDWDDICRRGLDGEVQPPRDEWIRDADGMPMYTRRGIPLSEGRLLEVDDGKAEHRSSPSHGFPGLRSPGLIEAARSAFAGSGLTFGARCGFRWFLRAVSC